MSHDESPTLATSRPLPPIIGEPVATRTVRMRDRLGLELLAGLPEKPATPATPEESLVVDDRFGVSPAQMVESKLSMILKEATLPVSHLQMRTMLRSR